MPRRPKPLSFDDGRDVVQTDGTRFRCASCWAKAAVEAAVLESTDHVGQCEECFATGELFEIDAESGAAWRALERAWSSSDLGGRKLALRKWAVGVLEVRFTRHRRATWKWQDRFARLVSPQQIKGNPYLPKGARADSARSSLAALLDHDDVFELGPRRRRLPLGGVEESSRFLSLRELTLVSLACGLWPKVRRGAGPEEVVAAEAEAMKKARARHGVRPFEVADLAWDAHRNEFDPIFVKQRIPRGIRPRKR